MSNRHVLFILTDVAFILIGVAIGLLLNVSPPEISGKTCQDVQWEVIYDG